MDGNDVVTGKTRWRRFGLVFGSSMAVMVVFLGLLATGAIAAPVVISGTAFKLSADSLTVPSPGPNAFVQYGNVDFTPANAPTGVATTVLTGAVLTNLNQTVCASLSPLPGNLLVSLAANPATATNLVVDATDLQGDATFTNIQIGVPVTNPRTGQVTFAQTANDVVINSLKQTAMYTSAGTFVLTGLHLTASIVGTCP